MTSLRPRLKELNDNPYIIISNLNMITEHRILRATIFYHFAYLCKNSQLLYIYSFFTPVNIRYVNNLTITSKYHYFTYTFQSWYLQFEKAWGSGRDSAQIRPWNPWFRSQKTMLSDCNLMGFRKHCQRHQKLYIYASFWAII